MVSQAQGAMIAISTTILGIALTFVAMIFDGIINTLLIAMPIPATGPFAIGNFITTIHIIIYLICIIISLIGIIYFVYVNWMMQEVDWEQEMTNQYG